MVFTKILKEGELFINKYKLPPVYHIKEQYFYRYNNYYSNEVKKYFKSDNNTKNKVFSYKTKKETDNILSNVKKEELHSMNINKEVIFCGKINTGKSSILNKVLSNDYCRTSRHPLTTKHIIGFNIYNGKIFDSPGIGNLKLKRSKKFLDTTTEYIKNSQKVVKIYYFFNYDFKIRDDDLLFFNIARYLKLPVQIVINKIDLAKKLDGNLILEKGISVFNYLREFEDILVPLVHFTSYNESFGIQELRESIFQSLEECPNRIIVNRGSKLVYYLEDNKFSKEEEQKYKLFVKQQKINDRKKLLT